MPACSPCEPACAAQARAGQYNPLPDLLRLERGMGTPIGSACDHISIMLRRDSDFGPVAAAFKCAPSCLPLSRHSAWQRSFTLKMQRGVDTSVGRAYNHILNMLRP